MSGWAIISIFFTSTTWQSKKRELYRISIWYVVSCSGSRHSFSVEHSNHIIEPRWHVTHLKIILKRTYTWKRKQENIRQSMCKLFLWIIGEKEATDRIAGRTLKSRDNWIWSSHSSSEDAPCFSWCSALLVYQARWPLDEWLYSSCTNKWWYYSSFSVECKNINRCPLFFVHAHTMGVFGEFTSLNFSLYGQWLVCIGQIATIYGIADSLSLDHVRLGIVAIICKNRISRKTKRIVYLIMDHVIW